MDENRDDTDLRSIVCPHCKQTIPVVHFGAFKKRQLLYLKCEKCGQGITKDQIDSTYREYVAEGE